MATVERADPQNKEESKTKELVTILVVDDDKLVCEALTDSLGQEGYRVLQAASKSEALEWVGVHAIGVIICDYALPDGSGAEVLSKVQELRPETSRIMLTGVGELQVAVDAINIGHASHFILKPWDNDALLRTVKESVERYRLKAENQRLHALTLKQHAALSSAHDTLKRELQLGARVHEIMLLGDVPTKIEGLDIAALTLPSKDIDGDFFDFLQPHERVLDVIIGDVMGKGIPAALVGTAVKTQLTRFALPHRSRLLYQGDGVWQEDILAPKEVMERVQKAIAPQLIGLEYFVSLFYGRFDLVRSSFTFVDCGAAKPLHYRREKRSCRVLKGENLPLGILQKEAIQQREVHVRAGDVIVFCSDGLTDARSPSGESYGMERTQAIIEQHAEKDAQELLEEIRKDVVAFTGRETFDDDFTVITLRVISSPIGRFAKRVQAKFAADMGQLPKMREFVKKATRNVPGERDLLYEQLELVMNEVFTNIARHGYEGVEGGEVLIESEAGGEGISFHISDQGAMFDPTHVDEPDLAGGKPGGFGWYIIREMTDEISYSAKASAGGWNHLHIFKRYITQEEQMNLSHSRKDDVLVITLEGDHLDAKEAPAFKQQVIELMANEGVNRSVFDLTNLRFIDSSGLGAFLSVLKFLNGQGGDLKLAGMSRTIRTMFELVCMHKIFEIFNTTEQAVSSFTSNTKA